MLKSLPFLLLVLAMPAALRADDTAIKLADDESLVMAHTGGWGAGRLAELHVKKDGSFTYVTRAPARRDQPNQPPPAATTLQGKFTHEQLEGLRKQIADAKEGPGAEDAGVVQFFWRDEAGKPQQRDYTMPRAAPSGALLKAVDDAAKNSVKEAKEALKRV